MCALSEQSEQPEVLDELGGSKEIARRRDRLVRLAEAKAVLEAHAKERVAAEQTDYQEAEPTLSVISAAIGTPEAAALDAGYFGPATLAACTGRGIELYIATGRDPHHPSWQQRFAPLPDPPPEDASPQVNMAYKLKTALGKAIDGARTCTVEPAIGIIKEVLGFRQFSLRRVQAAAGEWCLVCLACNLKRFHTLSWA